MSAVNAVVGAFLLTFASLFPIVNPLESAPFFLALTPGMSQAERRGLAGRVAMNGFALLLGSMVLGPWLLVFFGIELPVVRIAGGLVITAIGWKLLTQEDWSDHSATAVPSPGASGMQLTNDNAVQSMGGRRVGSFYPLTMPLTVGPGSISVAITIGSRKSPEGFQVAEAALHALGALMGITAIAATIYLAYRFAGTLGRLLGATGLEVMVRLSAFFLMCIGIEIVWNGYSALSTGH